MRKLTSNYNSVSVKTRIKSNFLNGFGEKEEIAGRIVPKFYWGIDFPENINWTYYSKREAFEEYECCF